MAALLDAAQLAADTGRDDIAARLRAAMARACRLATVACVVGEFKQGKSTLVNVLLGEEICPVDDDLADGGRHAARPRRERAGATVHHRRDGVRTSTAIAVTELRDVITESANPGTTSRPSSASTSRCPVHSSGTG